MTITLEHAQVYDIEMLPNVFTLTAEHLHSDTTSTWEISAYRDDRRQLLEWFNWLQQNQIPMIGFNSESYDYPIIHMLMMNPNVTYQQMHDKSQQIIGNFDNRFAHTIWPSDRFAPQIDLFKLHHFDNKAKTTSLKALQFAMRSPFVVESSLPFDRDVTAEEIDTDLIPYNKHDVLETKRFAHYSMDAINFRLGIINQFGVECLSWNDTKIGEKMLEKRLGDSVCYDRSSGKRQRRQTVRDRIALADIIFPYVRFETPEFQRVLDYMRAQVLTPADASDPDSPIATKGVFTDLHAHVGGLDFHFGTGGVHASVEAQRFVATEDWLLRDIDVGGMYPAISNVNRLAPEHLGEAFVEEYAKLPAERSQHPKGTHQNGLFKLAGNAAWGKSNSMWSVFYDSQYAMTIPINGQLLICMLAEWLLAVPTITLISANTDGITYRIHRDHLAACEAIEKRWEAFTCLTLEGCYYSRVWIANVNNYIAEYAE